MQFDKDFKVDLAPGQVAFAASPIEPTWILEGTPDARSRLLTTSADGAAMTLLWECTAGRFNWYYDGDETVYVIDGGVTLKDASGATHRVSAGDTVFFPAGSRAEWTIDRYIRKVAFCRAPLSPKILRLMRVYRFLMRLVGRGGDGSDVKVAFGGGSGPGSAP